MALQSSSEIFQMKNYETFGDINGIFVIANAMMITGKDEHEHDEILRGVSKDQRKAHYD